MNKHFVAAANKVIDAYLGLYPTENLIGFYSRNQLANQNPVFQHLCKRIFYTRIDPIMQSLDSEAEADKMRGLVFDGKAGLQWSEQKRPDFWAMMHYYLSEGKSSCLTPIIDMIEKSNRPGWRLLDLGCGSGNAEEILFKKLGEQISRVDGVDFSEPAIIAARKRCPDKCNFYAIDLLDWLEMQKSTSLWRYDIGFFHLTLQLFPEDYVQACFRLLRQKRICKTLFISDTYLEKEIVAGSYYNPGPYGYIRYDHNHEWLLNRAGYDGQVIADYRQPDGLGFVFWRGK